MERAKCNGLMVKFIKESMRMIKSMVLALSAGPMEGSTLDSGRMANSMEVDNITCRIKAKKSVNGCKVRG